jgi:hypothetical protein
MSDTKRNIKHVGWAGIRHPRTYQQLRQCDAAKEAILEVGCEPPNRLKQKANPRGQNTISAWDDKPISGYREGIYE